MLTYLNPLLWVRWFFGFVFLWLITLPWDDLAKSIPALLLVVVMGAVGTIAINNDGHWRDSLLTRQFDAAWNSENYEAAELILRRQLQTRSDDATLTYRLAIAREALAEQEDETNIENATAMMRQLVRSRNHVPAARWLLRRLYVGSEWNELEADQQSEVGQLLQIIHNSAPNDLQIAGLYAECLIVAGRSAEAIPLLAKVATKQPMQGLRAAAIARAEGLESQAVTYADLTLRELAKRQKLEPSRVDLSIGIAQVEVFMNRHMQAVKTLEATLGKSTDKDEVQQLRLAVSDAVVSWINYEESQNQDSSRDHLRTLKMLQYALRYAPENPRVLTLVSDRVLDSLDEDSQQVAAVRTAIIDGVSPGLAHFIQGTAAMVDGETEKGMRHLKMAAELMPESGSILNNLAAALSMREDADLEQALKLSQAAIDQTPSENPIFHETRGQILVKMKRYTDAIPDLERALPFKALEMEARKSLAISYDAIGESEIAEQHRQAIR